MFAESISQELYDNICNEFGAETAYKMNSIYEYITGNKDKHALISLQFDDKGNFDVNGGWFKNPTEVDSGFGNLVDANELTAGKIVGYTIAPALFYMTYILYDIIYKEAQKNPADVEFDIIATLGDVATEIADKDDVFQIAVGGILNIICDGVMDGVKIRNDLKQLEEDLIDEEQLRADLDALSDSYRQVATDYLKAVVNPLEASTNWFELYSSVTELKATIDSIAVVNDAEVLVKDIFTNTANLYCNVYGTVFALAKESILNHHEMCLEIVVAGTETIINKVENWDTATKYVEAQKQLTTTWDSHSRQIQSMAEDFTDDSSELCEDFKAYSKSALNFMTEMATYYAENKTDNGSADFSSALQEVKDAQQELLSDIKEVYSDSVEFLEAVGTAMKELVTDSFEYVHAWGEDEVKNIILDWADSLCENLKSVDLEEVVLGWVFRVTDSYNDATDCVYGVSGDMQIHGTEKRDYLYGRKGNSELYGEGGNDTLFGGTGNDRLEGGAGQDTYCFNLGDGTDIIYDYESVLNNDKIVFGSGIRPEDVTMERVDFDLIVKYSATDSFKVQGAYRVIDPEGLCFVESMEFADGTVWNTEDIANRANIHIGTEGDNSMKGYEQKFGYNTSETFHGGAGNDTINAEAGNDTLYGEEGADTLKGGAGNDTLVGGAGNDELEGGAGQDTYIFNLGDGVDTIYDYESILNSDKIVFGTGVNPVDVTMERVGENLVVKYSATDSFTVQGAYRVINPEGLCFVESMEFADGTVWNTEDIANRANIHIGTEGDNSMKGYEQKFGYNTSETFHGGAGNDTINAEAGNDTLYGEEGADTLKGGAGNDTLVGGAGNDYLDGGAGSDTYIIGANDGNDAIYNYDTTESRMNDKIIYGEGVHVDDLSISKSGADILITNNQTGQTTLIKSAYLDANKRLYNLEFSDNSSAVIDYSTLSLNITHTPDDDITETSQEDGVSAVSEAEVNKMTDLMVQEMAGVSMDGTTQDITTDNTVVTESDTLLWTE
ncbi:MAG: hypothetical protein E7284_05275 [Lachnospiraceae bacterium]|nr:hypothetical protein [Lachnospiraceae bacterium]